MGYRDTKVADVEVGSEIALLKYPSFGTYVDISRATVQRITKTRVIISRGTRPDGTDLLERWVVNRNGEITGREGAPSYSSPHFALASDKRVAQALRTNEIFEIRNSAVKALRPVYEEPRFAGVEEIDAAIAALQALKSVLEEDE